MPRKRNAIKTSAPTPGIRDDPSLTDTFESVVDYIQRRSFLNFITSGFFGFNGPLYIPQDDYDYHPYHCAHNGLQPHPRIRELAEEEAEKHAQELIEEEKRCKEKTEKNRRKKLRKKEKRIEKRKAVKAPSPGDERNSETHEGEDFNESDGEKNGPTVESAETQNLAQTAEDEERSEAGEEEERSEAGEEEERSEAGEDEERSEAGEDEERSEAGEDEERSEAGEEEEKPVRAAEEEGVEIKSPVDPTAEEDQKRSKELAGMGCSSAVSGQYETAVRYFTDAIKCNPTEFKLFGNRSLCYERMQQYENACRDADIALSMEPKWIKGLFRKGKALCGLKRYYEASLIYREVMELDSSSVEAKQELKRAQTLHLMEMGFSWEQSSEALKTHATLEGAIESLFDEGGREASNAATTRPLLPGVSTGDSEQAALQDDHGNSQEEEEWTLCRPSRQRQRAAGSANLSRIRSLPTPRPGNAGKSTLFSVWVGVLAPSVTYAALHQLFSRAGTVSRIKMLLDHQCAFVSYTREEDCDRAVQSFNGMLMEGTRLTVRHPGPTLCSDPCRTKECFFWRTTGCTRSDCNYLHNPNHKGMDRDKFTAGLGNF